MPCCPLQSNAKGLLGGINFRICFFSVHKYIQHIVIVFQIYSQLEGSLSQWTSYQEDVRQFVSWVERVEESLDPTEKHYPEMRDKTANLSKAKVLVLQSVFILKRILDYN